MRVADIARIGMLGTAILLGLALQQRPREAATLDDLYQMQIEQGLFMPLPVEVSSRHLNGESTALPG